MNIKIVCVGKIKEKFYRDAIEEYAKRLSRFCKFEIVEVQEEPTAEDNNLANAIPDGDPVINIDPNLVSPV